MTGVGDVTSHEDPAVGVVGGDGSGDVTLSKLDQGLTLPLLVDLGLAAVGGQLDDMEGQSVRQRPQSTTGVDGRDLTVVTYQDQLPPGLVDLGLDPVQAATAHERRLVDDDHMAGVSVVAPRSRSMSSRAMVTDSMPEPAWSSAAVLLATAVPMTR